MAPLLAVSLGLVTCLFLSYTYPNFKWVSFYHVESHKGSVIAPSLAAFIEETMALENITGLSVAIVPKHDKPEFRAWGYRTEDGDEMTPDVSHLVLVYPTVDADKTLTLFPDRI